MSRALKSRVVRVQGMILKWRLELDRLREQCSHPDVKRIPRSDTGNWCPGDDRYWYECCCIDCGKRWEEPQ